MKVRTTGIREAKAHLSRLLRDVQHGGEWVITERGKPIARLVPVSGSVLPLAERVRRLEDAGLIESAHRAPRNLPPPLPLKRGLAQAWLQEDRDS